MSSYYDSGMARRTLGGRRRRGIRRGRGFFDLIKSGLSKIHNYVKDNKILSNMAGSLIHPLAGQVVGRLGYGRRRRVGGARRRLGGARRRPVGLARLKGRLGLGRRRRVRKRGGAAMNYLM